MPLWEGETFACHGCGAVNAVIRKRCRLCGQEWWNPDPEIDADVASEVAESRAIDKAIELRMGRKLAGQP